MSTIAITPATAATVTTRLTRTVDTTDPMVTVDTGTAGAPPVDPRSDDDPFPPSRPTSSTSSDRHRRILPVVLGTLAALIGVASIVAGLVELSYVTVGPGKAWLVSDVMTIEGHSSYPPKGKLLFTTVTVDEGVNAWEALAGWADDDIDVISEETLRGPIPEEEFHRQSIEAMADSKTTAEVLALRHLGYTDAELNAGAEIVSIEPGSPADPVLEPGDVVVAVDGNPVGSSAEVVAAIQGHRPGDRVALRFVRGTNPPTDAEAVLAQGEEGQALLGVRVTTKIDLPFDIRFESGDITGPSAGLAYALALIDTLTPGEITGGQVVAVTGALVGDGSVHPIGGAAQKAVTVRRSGATLFLVPRENYDEAKAHAGDDLRVEAVGTLDEALQVLGTLRGSNATTLANSERPPAAGSPEAVPPR